MFLSEWGEFLRRLALQKKKKNLMTARVSMLLKSVTVLNIVGICNTMVL